MWSTTILVDQETIYAPRHGNDRLLLVRKGSLNEFDRLRQGLLTYQRKLSHVFQASLAYRHTWRGFDAGYPKHRILQANRTAAITTRRALRGRSPRHCVERTRDVSSSSWRTCQCVTRQERAGDLPDHSSGQAHRRSVRYRARHQWSQRPGAFAGGCRADRLYAATVGAFRPFIEDGRTCLLGSIYRGRVASCTFRPSCSANCLYPLIYSFPSLFRRYCSEIGFRPCPWYCSPRIHPQERLQSVGYGAWWLVRGRRCKYCIGPKI